MATVAVKISNITIINCLNIIISTNYFALIFLNILVDVLTKLISISYIKIISVIKKIYGVKRVGSKIIN